METVLLPDTGLTVSRLCLGGVPFGNTLDEKGSFALLDRFVELGGTFVDTARIYSDWVPGELRRSERVLGDWLKARGCRSRMVVGTKGAHPFIDSLTVPRTSAAEIRDDLEGSLRTLRTEVIDMYWLHRDDPARPVEHFIDLLNTFQREGKIRAFGASNWSVARIRAANLHARATGQRGFTANQPLWCLGCQQAKPSPIAGLVKFDAEAAQFHRESNLTVVPYTSQANGFFSKLARPRDQQPADLAQHDFHTPPNLATGKYVIELARQRKVTPAAIVLSYLWSRPFTVTPIVGARTSAQLEESMAAVGLRLAANELAELERLSQSGLPAGAG